MLKGVRLWAHFLGILYTEPVYLLFMIRLVQVVWEGTRIAAGVEFDDGSIVVRWDTGEGMRSYDHPDALLGDAIARHADVLGLSPPESWLRPARYQKPV
jgi:hypothetical protein